MAFKYLCLLLAALMCCASALPRHQLLSRSKRSMRLCGSMLVDALAAVCESDYYDPSGRMEMRKRNYEYSNTDNFPGQYDSSITEFNGFVDPQTALDFLGLQRMVPPRASRGVADECCQKSCTFNQLASYCGNRGKRFASGEKK
ncbi:hypothetical protein JTE90_013901 [Oedothorax gibbosus]|uniref:Insulin-like domain-containing protein n=1 Tax=Oedothorax gibbosus TaxID=931172 RepID=A0AAV6VFQ5_9ARAC|nr:hypothetical protein JTE90_013901 [Oedothorax gibbosus]